MADNISKEKRTATMKAIRSKDSKIEVVFRKELWKMGLRYIKNSSKYFGKPDVLLKKDKTVIFIDSCFWHGCKKHCRIPTTHRKYWTQKIERNIERDREVVLFYKNLSWKVIRIWEHQLKNSENIIEKIV